MLENLDPLGLPAASPNPPSIPKVESMLFLLCYKNLISPDFLVPENFFHTVICNMGMAKIHFPVFLEGDGYGECLIYGDDFFFLQSRGYAMMSALFRKTFHYIESSSIFYSLIRRIEVYDSCLISAYK